MNSTNTKTFGADKFSDIIEKEFRRKTQAIINMIRYTLDERGLTVDQLASLMEEPPTDVYRWISGANDLSLRNIAKFETALNINLTNCKRAPQMPSGHLDASTKRKITNGIKQFKKTHDMDNKYENRWLTWYNHLIDYYNENGHANVPMSTMTHATLKEWIRRNQRRYSKGKLDSNKEELLQILGISYRIPKPEEHWEEMYARLVKYKAEVGNVRITRTNKDKELFHWISGQRYRYWKGKLEVSKIMRLKQVGVNMRHKTLNLWEEKYSQLVEFKKKHGHLYVCRTLGASSELVEFARTQRRAKDNMSNERKKLLNKIDFMWKIDPTIRDRILKERKYKQWLVRYDELKAYKKRYGTSYISPKSEKHKSLSLWITKQRRKRDVLEPKKIRLLKEVDFFKDNGIKDVWLQS
ncbi:hypothetical protein EYV94_10340 [Puteibacter caeruleilacunae]|nr:hypothetical protein EYV94_10340 [Puteibacter caeruleilacunae]